MAAPLNTCTTIEQSVVVRFLWAKNMDAAKDIHKEMMPIRAAFLCGYPLLQYFLPTKKRIAHSIICTRLFRGKMHSYWFNGIDILQGRWQHGEKVGYCYPSGLEKTLCKWELYVPLVTKGFEGGSVLTVTIP
jgi:hypothetical protein